MCGIAGFNWQDEALAAQMNKCIAHRGPDESGVFADDRVSLGHQRLAIIDLSSAGHQPMEYGDFVLTYNGEIYNYKELKAELENAGYKFKSQSDTEIILAAYHNWGAEALKKFIGIFAFAIWDRAKKELFLARDQLGVKPLYYHHEAGKFIFASEIKAILVHPMKRQVNIQALNFLLRVLYVPEPETMFSDIYKLPAGHFAYLRGHELEIKKYWDVELADETRSFEEFKQEIQTLLPDVIRKQLVSDREVGVFLSGGWDSSTILGLMRDIGVEKIQTFSSGFETDNPKYNEDVMLARKTAAFYKTSHNEIILPSAKVMEVFEKAVYHLDEPNAAPTTLPMYYLSQFTKEKVTVVLGGDGGDELFAGYPRYIQSYYLNKFQKLPNFLRQLIPYSFLEFLLSKSELRRKLNTPPGYERFSMFKVYPEEKIAKILGKNFDGKLVPEYFASLLSPGVGRGRREVVDFEKSLMHLDLKNWLPAESLWKTDRMTAAHALEGRVPFLDPRLVELAFRIPTKYKIRNFAGKYIFKEAVKKYIPPHLHHEKKRGWLTPGSLWLKNELKPYIESVLSGEFCPEVADYFDLEYMRELYREHLAGNSQHMNQLWVLATFAMWYHHFKRVL